MATGGIFQLITNDGKQDKMLMASDVLKARLDAVRQARAQAGYEDTNPTLLDIEKTHILFTNAHFKPFAAIGFEYNKVNPNSGGTDLDSEITFSIPQFGDFFHDMVLYVKLKQPVLSIDNGTDTSDEPLMRWCDFPGERLLEKVEFEVNGNPLDKYQSEAMNYNREFLVQPNKELGWLRCVGQEEAEEGYLDQPNWASSGVSSADITHRFEARARAGDQTPTGQKDVAVYKEMFVPLLFWCNRDVRLAVPSVSIPQGQRFINLTLAKGEKLCNLYPRGSGTFASPNGTLNYSNMLNKISLYINNIFVNPEVHNIFIKRIGFSLIRVHRRQQISLNSSEAEIHLQQLKWPVETLFVGVRPKEYDGTTNALLREHLDKWYVFNQVSDVSRAQQGWRQSKMTDKADYDLTIGDVLNLNDTAGNNLRLTGVTSTVGANDFEGINAGDVLTLTLTSGNSGVVVDGTLNLEVAQVVPADGTNESYLQFKQLVSEASAVVGNTVAATIVAATTVSVKRQDAAEQTATVRKCSNTVDTITIRAHGISIYDEFQHQFYNAYIPYHYGGPNVRVPKDCGAMMIPFCLYPGTYQPSGHINVSRAREFYLQYTSSYVSSSQEAVLYVLAKVINFLLISDGSAVLRYST